MKLEDKVAIITGGEGPLGRAVSKKFLEEGANLVIGWYSSEEWQEARKLISGYEKRVVDMQVDTTKEEQVEALMKKASEAFGSIDILLHMVGHFHIGELIWEVDKALLDSLLEVNLKSAVLCAKHAVRAMLEKGQGRLVFFPARDAADPKPRLGIYAITKSGLITLTQALREELKDTGITVNAVMPSIMDTWKTRNMPHAEPDKWVKPEQIANLLASLCANECDALSGSVLKAFGKL